MNKWFYLVIIFVIAAAVAWWWSLASEPAPQIQNNNAGFLEQEPQTDIQAAEVQYFGTVNGYFVKPKADGEYPGVVMIHEWWGLNDNIKQMAETLAGQGYLVLAVDLYQGQVATTAEQARTLVGNLDQQQAIENLVAAVNYLKNNQASKVASLGWCFGGGQSLQLAMSGEPLAATVIYYGNVVTSTAALGVIDWPVLGIFGEADQSIPPANVLDFQFALNQVGVENNIIIYPGVGHAFANPSGANYAPDETKDAWEKTLNFLNTELK